MTGIDSRVFDPGQLKGESSEVHTMNPFGRRVGGFSYPQIVGGYPQIVGSLADQQESLRRAARSSGMPLPQGSSPLGSPPGQEQAPTPHREFPMGFFFPAGAKSDAAG